MDTQDLALMVIVGILLIALVIVNTTPVPTAVTKAMPAPYIPAKGIAPQGPITTRVVVVNPITTATTSVDVV